MLTFRRGKTEQIAMDHNNPSEESLQLKASLEHLRTELSYAKTHDSDWYEAFLKQINATNHNLKVLQRTITWFGWIFLLLTVAVLASLIHNGVLNVPSWQTVVSAWTAQ